MKLLLMTALLSPPGFSGGNVNDLARYIAESSEQSVVIMAIHDPTYPATEFDPKDRTAVLRALRGPFKLQAPAGELTLAHEGRLPRRMLADNPPEPVLPFKAPPVTLSKDGKVTFSTEGPERLNLRDLQKVPFSKPLKIHPLFEGFPLAVWAKDLPESAFLTMLARAAGGRLLDVPAGYEIRPDTNELKRRAKATVLAWREELKPNEEAAPLVDLQVNLLSSLIDESSPSAFERALEGTERVEFPVSRQSRAAQLVMGFVAQKGERDPITGNLRVETPVGRLRLPEDLDPRRPVMARLGPRMGFGLHIPIRSPNPRATIGFEQARLSH